jgi:TonB family protein
MTRILGKVGLGFGALGVNAALFFAIAWMNISDTSKPLKASEPRYAVFELRRYKPRKKRTRSAAPATPRSRPSSRPTDKPRRILKPSARDPRLVAAPHRIAVPNISESFLPGGSVPLRTDVFDARPAAPPPPKALAPGTVSEAELDRPPEFTYGTRPAYPAWADGDGSVTLKFRVDRKGRTSEIRVLEWSGHRDFVAAARRAAEKWIFRPGTRKGRPVAFWCRITIRFKR